MIYTYSCTWTMGWYLVSKPKKPRPRRDAWINLRAKILDPNRKVRPARFKPGPYADKHGNLRFLRRDKC